MKSPPIEIDLSFEKLESAPKWGTISRSDRLPVGRLMRHSPCYLNIGQPVSFNEIPLVIVSKLYMVMTDG